MKFTKGMQALSLFLVLALAGAMFVPAVSAESNQEYRTEITPIDVNSEVTSFFNEKSDTTVKASEIISLVNPGYYQNLTDDQKKEFENLDVYIPDINDPEATSEFTIISKKKDPNTKGAFVVTAHVDGFVDNEFVWLGVEGVCYMGSQRADTLMPSLETSATLFHRTSSTWVQEEYETSSTSYGWYDEAVGTMWNPDSGDYRTTAVIYMVFPPGFEPQTWCAVGYSSIITK